MQRYTRFAILLHWLIAVLIIGAFAMGLVMTDIPGLTPTKLKYYSWHKWAGVTILALAALRLLWRLANRAPPYPAAMPRWQQFSAHSLLCLLYVLMFAVPLSGYLYTLSAGVLVVYFGVLKLPLLKVKLNRLSQPHIKKTAYAVFFILNLFPLLRGDEQHCCARGEIIY